RPSSRKYPFIEFKPAREIGNDLLRIDGLSVAVGGGVAVGGWSAIINPGDKVAFVGTEALAKTELFRALAEEAAPASGSIKWGLTTSRSHFPKDNNAFFDGVELNLVDWLRQFSKEKSELFIRGFLGRMLFTGDESQKAAKVLSGGEKVRMMLARMMVLGANVLILDEPTNHLDLESITSLNNALIDTKASVLFSSQDHQFVQTVANRIIEIMPDGGIVDKLTTYDEYLETKQRK
ncbi:MAG: ATP-binding cassette domain-containing protein, partial [Clostridiales bacterium]|nr:ATP-binding cassette domain-containing protein [Clostridiales bacterium]